ncbi:MAG: helix-turn-helix transcriptional regulator [Acidobacteriota bacterium]
MRRAINKGIRAQIEELHEEVAAYERLKASTVEDLELGALNELPLLLIRARVAQGLTRKDLAGSLGIAEQQIQHFESTNYASANLRRVLEIVRALGIDLREPAQLRQVDTS